MASSSGNPEARARLRSKDDESRLSRGFAGNRSALVAYLMAGYPDREHSLEALKVVAAAGADIIELGVPHAHPVADGPVIQRAAEAARTVNRGGFGLAESIALAAEFLEICPTAPPIALMTYVNPMMRLGLAAVAAESRRAGLSGFVVPDMPPEAAGPWLAVADSIDTVFLASPTSTPERLMTVGSASRGFVYCVSSLGVTGERGELSVELVDLVARVKASTLLPVAVGFGIGTPEQAATISQYADGVVVGSGIVRRQHNLDALDKFVRSLTLGLHGNVVAEAH